MIDIHDTSCLFLSTEDFLFLKQLGRELNEQPTDGNCDPRWWGVREKHTITGLDPEYSEYLTCFDGEMVQELESRTMEDLIDELTELYGYHDSDFADCTDFEDVVSRANEIAAETKNIKSYAPFSVVGCRDSWELVRGPMFLTKKACMEHIQRFGYNYSDPKSYVMTAFRCPEYERLLEILKKIGRGDRA